MAVNIELSNQKLNFLRLVLINFQVDNLHSSKHILLTGDQHEETAHVEPNGPDVENSTITVGDPSDPGYVDPGSSLTIDDGSVVFDDLDIETHGPVTVGVHVSTNHTGGEDQVTEVVTVTVQPSDGGGGSQDVTVRYLPFKSF